jgi:glycosyltransferase involved in cell wall biosynthesis
VTRPEILFLTRFTAINAASRYRVLQYLPFLEDAGFRCTVRPLFPDAYINLIFREPARRRRQLRLYPLVAACLARRWWLLSRGLSQYQMVHVQYEALPFAPLFCEQSLYRDGRRVIVDFDDAVSLTYETHPNPLVRRLLMHKVPSIVARSRLVTVANRNLAEWARKFSRHVMTIPNSVDLRKYPPTPPRRRNEGPPVIGWIGTPVTARFLKVVEEPLRQLSSRYDFVLKVIGAPRFRMEGVNVVAVPWNECTEVEELRTLDVGIMPLTDDPWSRGKSALKLIQYMASGVPAIASPVGANCEVLQDGINGFLAATDREWVEKLATLIEQRSERMRLASAGYRTVEERFSLQSSAPRLVDAFCRAVAT